MLHAVCVQDEALMMFFAIELLRTVEALHRAQIVHGSISLSSVLLRNEISSEETMVQAAWTHNGSQGWGNRGTATAARSQLLGDGCVCVWLCGVAQD